VKTTGSHAIDLACMEAARDARLAHGRREYESGESDHERHVARQLADMQASEREYIDAVARELLRHAA
jgi:hypothetical protein